MLGYNEYIPKYVKGDLDTFNGKAANLKELFQASGYAQDHRPNVSSMIYRRVKNKDVSVTMRVVSGHRARVEFSYFNRKTATAKSIVWSGSTTVVFNRVAYWLTDHAGNISKVLSGEVTQDGNPA